MKVDFIPAEYCEMFCKFLAVEDRPYIEGEYDSSDGLIIDRYIDGARYRMTLEVREDNKVYVKNIERR